MSEVTENKWCKYCGVFMDVDMAAFNQKQKGLVRGTDGIKCTNPANHYFVDIPPRILATLKRCYFKRPAELDRQHVKYLLDRGLIEIVQMSTIKSGIQKVYFLTDAGKKVLGE